MKFVPTDQKSKEFQRWEVSGLLFSGAEPLALHQGILRQSTRKTWTRLSLRRCSDLYLREAELFETIWKLYLIGLWCNRHSFWRMAAKYNKLEEMHQASNTLNKTPIGSMPITWTQIIHTTQPDNNSSTLAFDCLVGFLFVGSDILLAAFLVVAHLSRTQTKAIRHKRKLTSAFPWLSSSAHWVLSKPKTFTVGRSALVKPDIGS